MSKEKINEQSEYMASLPALKIDEDTIRSNIKN